MKPDYQSYTLEELYDVKVNIDKEAYPERYENLLIEIKLREEAAPKVMQKATKTKRKRTNNEKIVTSSFLLIVAIAVFYFEYIPGKHGGISMKEDPFFFWGILLFCVGMAVNQLLTLESNQKKSDHDA